MTTERLKIRPQAPQSVLAARCCCPHFVPNWCCRGDVYFRRVTELVEERRRESIHDETFGEMKMSGREI